MSKLVCKTFDCLRDVRPSDHSTKDKPNKIDDFVSDSKLPEEETNRQRLAIQSKTRRNCLRQRNEVTNRIVILVLCACSSKRGSHVRRNPTRTQIQLKTTSPKERTAPKRSGGCTCEITRKQRGNKTQETARPIDILSIVSRF